jgi:nucleotide-binding universal stress UspA family protein
MAFQKILCPVDFSPGSQRAVAAAIGLANERDAELVLFHSWYLPPSPMVFASAIAYPPDLVQQLRDDAQRGLEAAVADAAKLGARRISSKLGTGVPWQQIVDTVAADPTFDLIVIGSHGRTGLARVMLGSVAELVVRHAPCPVLTVRGESRSFGHVLCPVDFSPWSRVAVDLAAELVHPGGAGITLLHVLESPVAFGELRPLELYRDLDRHATELLERWAKELTAKVTVPVRQQRRAGHAGPQLLAALDGDPTFDLVVMGSHGRTGIKRLALGSIAEKIVRHAHCPVLVAHCHPDRPAPASH